MALRFPINLRDPNQIVIPNNFQGDVGYFSSPEYQAFQSSSMTEEGVPRMETADLAYTSPYFGAGLSSSRGQRQDQAYRDYLNRIQGSAPSAPTGGIIKEDFNPRVLDDIRNANLFSPNYSNPINFLSSPPITPGEPAAGASQIDASIRPFLTEGLRQAQEIFLRQQPSMYPGQMYVSPSEQTLQSLQAQEDIARQGSPILGQAQGAFLRGLTAPSAATPLYQDIFGAAGMQPGADIYGRAAQGGFQNIATGQLANIAGGGFLNANPYQQQMMQAATRPLTQAYGEQVLPGIASLYSKSGRLGSGSMERALGTATEQYGRALGDVTAGLAGSQFQQERGLQQQALGQLAGVSAQDIQTRLFGAQGLQQAQQAALGTQLQAAGGVGTSQYQELQRQLAASQAAPQMYAQQFIPAQQLGQIGAQREAIAAQPLQERMTRYAYEQRLPYEQLSGYLSSVYGSPLGSFGTPAPQPQFAGNQTIGAIGGGLAGGLGGYALGSMLPSSFLGGYGGAAGGALGALGGGLLGGGFF